MNMSRFIPRALLLAVITGAVPWAPLNRDQFDATSLDRWLADLGLWAPVRRPRRPRGVFGGPRLLGTESRPPVEPLHAETTKKHLIKTGIIYLRLMSLQMYLKCLFQIVIANKARSTMLFSSRLNCR
jgi:hypothetical protein